MKNLLTMRKSECVDAKREKKNEKGEKGDSLIKMQIFLAQIGFSFEEGREEERGRHTEKEKE